MTTSATQKEEKVVYTPQFVYKESPASKIIENIFSALTLITLGIVFLLNTTNIVSWTMWEYIFWIFLSVWPIFLVIAGIQLILGDNWFAKLVGKTVGYVIFIAVLAVSILATSNSNISSQIRDRSWFGFVNSQTKNDIKNTLEVPKTKYNDVEKRNLDLKFTSGKFTVTEGSESYIKVDAKYNDTYGEPEISEDFSNKELNLTLKQKDNKRNFFFFLRDTPEYSALIGQSDIPTSLKLNMTAGDGDINFSSLSLKRAEIVMTAGDLGLSLKDKSLPEELKLTLTAGDLSIDLPKDISLEVEYNKTAGDITIGDKELKNGQDNYVYNSGASKKIKVTLKVTAGDLTINLK